MSAEHSDDRAGEEPSPADAQDAGASTCDGVPVGDEEARLNAQRLSLAERWRRVLDEPSPEDSESKSHPSAPPERARREEFWEAREMSDIWARAQSDPALRSMLHQEEIDEPEAEPLDQGALEAARARFQSRIRESGA